jgi:hypothetical protein
MVRVGFGYSILRLVIREQRRRLGIRKVGVFICVPSLPLVVLGYLTVVSWWIWVYYGDVGYSAHEVSDDVAGTYFSHKLRVFVRNQ